MAFTKAYSFDIAIPEDRTEFSMSIWACQLMYEDEWTEDYPSKTQFKKNLLKFDNRCKVRNCQRNQRFINAYKKQRSLDIPFSDFWSWAIRNSIERPEEDEMTYGQNLRKIDERRPVRDS